MAPSTATSVSVTLSGIEIGPALFFARVYLGVLPWRFAVATAIMISRPIFRLLDGAVGSFFKNILLVKGLSQRSFELVEQGSATWT